MIATDTTTASNAKAAVAAVASASSRTKTVKATVEIHSGELIKLLNRALNTMEPKDWPTWVGDILGGHVENGQLVEGIRPTDRTKLVFEREVAVDDGQMALPLEAAPAQAAVH